MTVGRLDYSNYWIATSATLPRNDKSLCNDGEVTAHSQPRLCETAQPVKQSRTMLTLVLDYYISMIARNDHDDWVNRYSNFLMITTNVMIR